MDKLAVTQVPVHPLLAGRWSPRGFDPAHALTDGQLTALLEAARWAPSANNTQPWRFVVGNRGDAAYDMIFGVVFPGNQVWAGAASALILVAAETVAPDGTPRRHALYDTGQAVANLVVQAGHEGLSVHQMGGFDADAARKLGLPDGVEPVVVLAIGRYHPDAALPAPLDEREQAPRVRRPVDELTLRLPAPIAA
jgi:nitroreductase